MHRIATVVAVVATWLVTIAALAAPSPYQTFKVPSGAHPHDVAPATDGGVWYTAQFQGALGKLDPATGKTKQIPLGRGSAPHGVIVGPDGNAWVTDGGQNAMVKVDAKTEKVTVFPLPASASGANLNTAAFDTKGILWFTGQSGYYGRLDPGTAKLEAWAAPRGYGPYGITATPDGGVYYASLAGNHIAKIDTATGKSTPIDPPTKSQGARRVWSDSKGNVWVSYWSTGMLGRYDPKAGAWKEWSLPNNASTYAVYVDDHDQVWMSDFSNNAIVRFDPKQEKFQSFPLPSPRAAVRQILGRPGEVWLPASATDEVFLLRTNK